MQGLRLFFACLLLAALPASVEAALNDCGQPVSTGATPTASDALFVLRSAIGTTSCDVCVCDVDFTGGTSAVTASDALRVLRRAVGQSIELSCPGCTAACESAQAPACGGDCPAALTCALDAFDEARCTCLNDCELSGAPACGGSCAFAAPLELDCRQVQFGNEIGPVSLCLCLPPDLETCANAAPPGCAGACGPATVCAANGDACECQEQPLQGACGEAVAPACGGTCPTALICVDQDGACACLDASSHGETCTDASGPGCGGACTETRLCAVNGFGACECFESCAVARTPACGGECLDLRKTCVAVAIDLGGAPFDACQCHVVSSSP